MKPLIVKCPTCSKKHDYYQSKPWSPFCSERCRLIDLGAWASEAHRIKGKSLSISEEDASALKESSTVSDFLNPDNKFIN